MPIAELTLLVVVTGYSFFLGRQILRYARLEFATWAGDVAASSAIGLGMIAYLIFALGLAGQLHFFAVLTASGVSAGIVFFPAVIGLIKRCVVRNATTAKATETLPENRSSDFKGPPHSENTFLQPGSACRTPHSAFSSPIRLFQTVILIIVVFGTLLSALAPPTAGDALCYHLEIPKRFVQLGEMRYLPLTDNSLFPFLMEMLYTLGLLLRGPVLAQLFHWLVGILLALAVVELAMPMVGRAAGYWAGMIALLVPGVTNQMTAPLNDLAVALNCTLMVVAWTRWNGNRLRRWLLLAGVFGGLALSVKLVSAAMVAMVIMVTAWNEWRRHGFGVMGRAISIFILPLCLTGGVWYARSWYSLGNPVYPYFNGLFGLESHTRSLLRTGHSFLGLPWHATMHPEEFGGRGVQFGAVFLALLPGLGLVPRLTQEFRRLLLLALGYCVVWFTFRQDLRFLLPIIPMLAIGVVAVVRQLRESHWPAFAVASVCVVALLGFQALIVVKRARPCLAVALGWESREAYLVRHEPSFQVARFVNTELPVECRVISQDYRAFYFEADFVREDALRRFEPYSERGDVLVEYLAARGFTHILLVQSENPETAIYDQSFTERLGPAAKSLPRIAAIHFDGPRGDRRDYQILALPGASGVSQRLTPRRRFGLGN